MVFGKPALLLLILLRVVALLGSGHEARFGELYLYLAKLAIVPGIAGIVADAVLAGEFLRYLCKGFIEIGLPVEHQAAAVICQLLRDTLFPSRIPLNLSRSPVGSARDMDSG